jgi:hypothetical protein
MQIRELVEAIHTNSKEHGWWESERSFGELIALCHSELSEALEEYRNGHELNETYYKCEKCVPGCITYDETIYCHKDDKKIKLKPEGIPVELADVVIRIMDMCGRYEYDVQKVIETGEHLILRGNHYDNFGEFITLCHRYLSSSDRHWFEWLAGLIVFIQKFCENEGIDLESAIIEKHEFNKTRPYKHGGKVI